MAIFIIRLEGLARQEIRSIESHSHKAMENDQQIQSLINNISDGVVAVDHNLRVIMYNAAALDVLDVNVNIRGKHIRKFLQPVNAESQPVSIDDLLHATTTQINNRDLSIEYTDGSRANLYLGIAPIYLGYGKSGNNGYTIVMRDITREKSLEEERDEFISVVSHELRTPIAITEGNISNAEFVAAKTKDISAIQGALKESHKQVLFLADMINDLSTLSRAERGVLEVDVETISIEDLATELSTSYTPQAEAKGLSFAVDIDPEATVLHSSRLYTKEILQNFITNAIKYTDEGTVTLHAYADPKGIRFAVQDTGIGISKGDQQKVFDKFFRSEDYRTRKANGTGLGLYVTMKLTRLIHAEIAVESELNKGSTFTILMPNLEETAKKKAV
jgi:signal transduction histidine kinase